MIYLTISATLVLLLSAEAPDGAQVRELPALPKTHFSMFSGISPQARDRRSAFRSGFTVLELLVAVGVIGFLALLLFPVASQLRSAGNQARCAGNLKQIIAAYMTKIADNGGRFPPSRAWKEYVPETGTTRPAANSFMNDMLSDYIPNPVPQLKRKGATVRDAGVYWCPGRDPAAASLSQPGGQAGEQGAAFSYAHNVKLGGVEAQPTVSWLGPDSGNQPNPVYNPALARLAAVVNPSEIIAFTEQAYPGHTSAGNLFSTSWPFPKDSPREPATSDKMLDFARHGGHHVNAAFLDGSVRPMALDDVRGTVNRFLVPASR